MEQLLREWKFEGYIEKFKDEEITVESLLLMTEDTLRSVVHKAGPRALMLHRIAEYRRQISTAVGPTLVEPERTLSECNNLKNTNDDDISYSTYSDSESVVSADDLKFQHQTSANLSTDSFESQSFSDSCHQQPAIAVDLHSVLSTNALGVSILNCKCLDTAKRRLLVDILANDIMMKFDKPSRYVYLGYAKAIAQMFPAERMDTYFVPSYRQSLPRGKLYFKVTNLKKKQKDMGLLTSTSKQSGRTSLLDSSGLFDNADEECEENLDDIMKWLLANRQPQSKLLEYWQKTARKRLRSIHCEESPDLVKTLEQWPRYKDEDGHILISRDFALMYPHVCNRMVSVWPKIYPKVLERIHKDRHKQFVKMLETFLCDPETKLTDDTEMCLTLLMLPLLLSESIVIMSSENVTRKRKVCKPTPTETMQYFIDLQEPYLDIQRYLEEKADCLARKSLGFQPHVIVLNGGKVGTALPFAPNSTYYAVISKDVFFKSATLLEAVDTCIMSTYVFGLKFPTTASSCWNFLDRAVYDISVNGTYEPVSSKVLELVSDTVTCT